MFNCHRNTNRGNRVRVCRRGVGRGRRLWASSCRWGWRSTTRCAISTRRTRGWTICSCARCYTVVMGCAIVMATSSSSPTLRSGWPTVNILTFSYSPLWVYSLHIWGTRQTPSRIYASTLRSISLVVSRGTLIGWWCWLSGWVTRCSRICLGLIISCSDRWRSGGWVSSTRLWRTIWVGWSRLFASLSLVEWWWLDLNRLYNN